MKKLFPILLLLFIGGQVAGQSDTLMVLLDDNDKPTNNKLAPRYGLIHRDNNQWKKVVFDAYDGNFAPVPTVWVANLIYNNPAGPAGLNGLTVNQVLFEAEKKLGGCSSPYTGAQLNTAVYNINLSYLGGVAGASSSMLSCPAPPKLGDIIPTIGSIVAYPNPTEGQLNIRFVTENDGKVVVRLFDALGKIVFNETETAFEGINERTYDVSNLSKGVYMLNVQVNGMTETIRVVVK